jgi:signal transduction histidine kinase
MQRRLWRGALKASGERGACLVYYPVISLSSWPPFPPQPKVLFDIAASGGLDGLLVWYAGIAEGLGMEGGRPLLDRYGTLPLVTIGAAFPDRPDISIDNYEGAFKTVEHIARDHGRRRIAVIRGPRGHPDADERYRGYAEALRANGLPEDARLVAETYFEFQRMDDKIGAIVSRWLGDPSLGVDAIVAASDYMALSAIKALKSSGRRVPEDVIVAGFDDVDDARSCAPSLTTVRQPFFEMGYRSVEILLGIMDGEWPPLRTVMPMRLIRRESCGCPSEGLASGPPRPHRLDPLDRKRELWALAKELGVDGRRVEDLLGGLGSDARSGGAGPGRFLPSLREILSASILSDFDGPSWRNALARLGGWLRAEAGVADEAAATRLLDRAQSLVADMSERAAIWNRIELERLNEEMRRVSEALITSFGEPLLHDALCGLLPKLGFPAFYLSLYRDPGSPDAGSVLVLAYSGGGKLSLPAGGLAFPTGRLAPESPFRAAAGFVVEPLYYRDEQIGMLVLESGPAEGPVYENVRAQVSGALKGSTLLGQVREHAARLERRVAERTAELSQAVGRLKEEVDERRKAEETIGRLNQDLERRVRERTLDLEAANAELEAFAYSVSHDLRAPLRAIGGFSAILRDDFAQGLPPAAASLLGKIAGNAERMGELIDDLLMFSRAGRDSMRTEDVDSGAMVRSIIGDLEANGALGAAEALVAPDLPPCKGDASMIRQVWTNLISNAVKFSAKKDRPRLEVGFSVQDGRVVYSVADNGAGFDMKYADKLFGVFQRLHRAEEFEGTGIGLALAMRIVKRHGGDMWAVSRLDEGATFFFSLNGA